MASAKILQPFILSFEGGYVNDKNDKGGATNKGVTLATYQAFFGKSKTSSDLRKITDDEWYSIYKSAYWDKCKADMISSQSVANLLVDFAWHSGVSRAAKKIQGIVGVKADGIIGDKTVTAINNYPSGQHLLFDLLKTQRVSFINSIATGAQSKYKRGWLRRVSAIVWGSLKCNGGNTITW